LDLNEIELFNPNEMEDINVDMNQKKYWTSRIIGEMEVTGNEGTNRETTYHSYFIIMWPKNNSFKMICKTDTNAAIAWVKNDQSNLSANLEILCNEMNNQIITKQSRLKIETANLLTLLDLIENSKDGELFELFLKSLPANYKFNNQMHCYYRLLELIVLFDSGEEKYLKNSFNRLNLNLEVQFEFVKVSTLNFLYLLKFGYLFKIDV
jgi:hypothetical protein